MGAKRKRKLKVVIAPAGELRARFGLTAENRPQISLDKRRVPEPLWSLIPDAELIGVSDDLIRDDVVSRLPKEYLQDVVRRTQTVEDELNSWMTGPEADSPNPSDEYVAFAAMTMAIDI